MKADWKTIGALVYVGVMGWALGFMVAMMIYAGPAR